MDDYESLSTRHGAANVMWCSFRNAGARRCIRNCAGIWARYSGSSRCRKNSKVEEGHLMPDHVHMLLSIPPKYAVSQVVGFIKGKSAIHLARVYGERKRNFVGQHFGPVGSSSTRSAGMRRPSGLTSAPKRGRTRGSNK